MTPRKIILLLTFGALAIGNYALAFDDFKLLLIGVVFVWVFLAIHAHEDAVWKARREGEERGRKG